MPKKKSIASLRHVTFNTTVEVVVFPEDTQDATCGFGSEDYLSVTDEWPEDIDCFECDNDDVDCEDDGSNRSSISSDTLLLNVSKSFAHIYHEGWMVKRGGGWTSDEDKHVFARRSLKKRWFVLRENILKYYTKPCVTGKLAEQTSATRVGYGDIY